MHIQQIKQIEKQKTHFENIQTIQNEQIIKNKNKYDPVETEYKEKVNEKIIDNNNNMDIDDN